jgi:L-alanine-DL-glutamate epimerase-like enolase superfamily enzyme
LAEVATVKITDVRACVVQGNFPWVLVKVLTDEGITGIGEAYWGIGVRDVITRLKPFLVGQDPTQVDWLMHRLMRFLSGSGSQSGTVVTALSGIEIALWDIAGKALGVPVWKLLGSKFHDRIRIYCDCHAGMTPDGKPDYTPEGYAERARQVVAKGFTAIKFDLDIPTPYQRPHNNGSLTRYRVATLYLNRSLSNAEIRFLAELVAAVREAVGEEVEVALDCHWRFNTRDALRLAEAVAPYKPLWLEDPTPPENVDALAEVKRASPVPICTGENHYTAHQFRELIVKQACDIVAPDIPKVGGLRETQKIATLADLYYLPLAPHNVASPIATIAACHVCATIPHFLALEFHAIDVPWWDDLIVGEKPIIRDGFIAVPDTPGLGVQLNEEVVRAHLAEGEEFFA